jgi:hypothetical protein
MVGMGVKVAVIGREVVLAGSDVLVGSGIAVSIGVWSIPMVKVSLQAMRASATNNRAGVRVFIEPPG